MEFDESGTDDSRLRFWPLARGPARVTLPGLAPAGDSLSLASPRESKQREGEPGASSLCCAQGTLRCSASAGSAETRPTGSDICASLSAGACATRLRTRRWGAENQYPTPKQQGRAMARPCGARLFGCSPPLWLCREAQRQADQETRMSEPGGRVCAAPAWREHRRLPRRSRGHRHQGRLSFGYFALAKQRKVPRPPGRDPASHARANSSQRKAFNAISDQSSLTPASLTSFTQNFSSCTRNAA